MNIDIFYIYIRYFSFFVSNYKVIVMNYKN